MAFTPGLQQSGVNATRQAYPDGAAGIRLSLDEMARRIRDGRLDPAVRGWAIGALKSAGIDGRGRTNSRAQVGALLEALRSQTSYAGDPTAAEYIQSAAATLCLRPGLCIHGGDCFPSGTLVLRDDYVFVAVEALRVGDRIWGLDKWTRVDGVAFKGVLPIDAVDMNNGSTLHLTRGHKVFVGRCKHDKGVSCPTCYPGLHQERFERVALGDLQEGDVLLQPKRVAFGEGTPDPRRMYVEALALADGWVDADNRFRIAGRDGKRKEAQKREVAEICAQLGIDTHWHKRYITVNDADWSARIAALGSRARFKQLETINLSENAAREALRGLMADSAANTSAGRTYSTTSRGLMLQTRVLHRMFGVSASYRFLTPEQHGGAGKHPLWRLGIRSPEAKSEKSLMVKSIERNVRKAICWDVQTEDHYVYLPEHDVTVSNCDDLTVALASSIMSIGIPAVIVKQSFGRDAQEHVLVAAQCENGEWIYADPSTRLPVGSSVQARDEVWVDPLEPIGNLPAVQAEIVSLGAPRRIQQVAGAWCEERHGKVWLHHDGRWQALGVSKPTGVGLIFGNHTANELSVDLLNWQGFVTSLATSIAENYDKWKSADAAGYEMFRNAWNSFRAKWDAAATVAQQTVEAAKNSWRGLNWTIAEDEYQTVLQAYQNGLAPSPGGFDDLATRWADAMRKYGGPPPSFTVSLDPNAAPDADLITYKAADQAIKAAENAASGLRDPAKVALVSALIGAALAVTAVVVVKKVL
jgi:hypothetical protein